MNRSPVITNQTDHRLTFWTFKISKYNFKHHLIILLCSHMARIIADGFNKESLYIVLQTYFKHHLIILLCCDMVRIMADSFNKES